MPGYDQPVPPGQSHSPIERHTIILAFMGLQPRAMLLALRAVGPVSTTCETQWVNLWSAKAIEHPKRPLSSRHSTLGYLAARASQSVNFALTVLVSNQAPKGWRDFPLVLIHDVKLEIEAAIRTKHVGRCRNRHERTRRSRRSRDDD